MRPTVHHRHSKVLGHVDLGSLCPDIPCRVSDPKGNGVHTAVASVLTLGPQLHRLAIGGNHHVVRCVAGAGAIISLITCYQLNPDVADADAAVAVVVHTGHEVRDVEGVIGVV